MLKRLTIDGWIRELVRMAVAEDFGTGDRTVELAIPAETQGAGVIVARRDGVICGTVLIKEILAKYGKLKCQLMVQDGAKVKAGRAVARISGQVRAILSAERVVLNFLGRMSGVATMTRRYVEAVKGTKAVICDTRKTVPGWRSLDKYAVRCGGGVNHRMGLYDGVMLKDNHLAALRGNGMQACRLNRLVELARRELPRGIMLWLEVDTLEQLAEAIGGGADVVLLDNFSVAELRRAVAMRDKLGAKELLEASGGITLGNVAAVAKTGVDRISIGALTHSVPVLDLAMDWE